MTRKIKVLFVLHDTNRHSGAIASMIDVIDHLKELSEIHFEVLIPKRHGDLADYLKEKKIPFSRAMILSSRYAICRGVLFKYVSYLRAMLSQVACLLSALTISKKYRDFDVVYSNSSASFYGVYLARFLQNKKIRHIWHFREFGELDQGVCLILGGNLLSRLIGSVDSEIIYISESLRNHYISQHVNSKNIVVYDDVFVPSCSSFKKAVFDGSSDLKVLIAGTLCEGKGQKFAIDCLSHMKKKTGNLRLHLSLAGDDGCAYGTFLKQYVRDLGLIDNVIFLGFCEDMSLVRCDHHIALVASKSEAFGRVTIEAMASYLPVIVSSSGANTELVTDRETGFVYETSCVESLARVLGDIIENPDLLKVAVKAKQFSDNFTSHKCAAQINELIIKDPLSRVSSKSITL